MRGLRSRWKAARRSTLPPVDWSLLSSKAKDAANGKDVRIGGGVSVVRQYLVAGQIEEMHLAMSPVLLGEGENLFSGINLAQLGFKPSGSSPEKTQPTFLLKRD
jgi:dihydrofolate reductase